VDVSVCIMVLIATLLLAGCAGAVQIYLELMSDWMCSSDLPQRARTVKGASGRDEAPASLSRLRASRSTR